MIFRNGKFNSKTMDNRDSEISIRDLYGSPMEYLKDNESVFFTL